MSRVTPVGAVIEILERHTKTTSDDTGRQIVLPNDIRINGVSMLAPADCPVTVHEMSMEYGDLATLTLTLMARRIIIGHEDDVNAQPILYGQGYFFAEHDASNEDFPIRIQRRLALDDDQGVAVEHLGISVERAEQLIRELQVAVAQSRADA